MCGSDEKCGCHRYTFRPRCLSQKLSLFSINFVTGECTENCQLDVITVYVCVVQIHVTLLKYILVIKLKLINFLYF